MNLKYVYLVTYLFRRGINSGTGSIVIKREHKINNEEQVKLTQDYICGHMDNDSVLITNFILLNKRGK